jgi:hypothetical protein
MLGMDPKLVNKICADYCENYFCGEPEIKEREIK